VPRPRGAARRPFVTLSTDIGWAYAAQMKAVLSRSIDPGRVVDLTHDLPAHAIREAAFVVRAMCGGFPAGTIHAVVVDPGVGGRRRPIVVDCRDGSRLVGPDNGVLSPLADRLGGGVGYVIGRSRLALAGPRVGTTFDGRDLFAPTAAWLARGGSPAYLGPRAHLHDLRIPEPRRRSTAATGEVIHVDHFGNLISTIPTGWIPSRTASVRIRFGDRRPVRLPWVTSYEALGSGRPGALGSGFGTVEIAVAQGRAAERFRAGTGARLRVDWGAPGRVRN
jgi:S-adenosyl-L-methionine hydrolase (adenosine-forming)